MNWFEIFLIFQSLGFAALRSTSWGEMLLYVKVWSKLLVDLSPTNTDFIVTLRKRLSINCLTLALFTTQKPQFRKALIIFFTSKNCDQNFWNVRLIIFNKKMECLKDGFANISVCPGALDVGGLRGGNELYPARPKDSHKTMLACPTFFGFFFVSGLFSVFCLLLANIFLMESRYKNSKLHVRGPRTLSDLVLRYLFQ